MATNALQTKAFITVGGEAILVGSERYDKIIGTLTEWTEAIVEEKICRYKLDVVDDVEWNALISDKNVLSDVLEEQHERRLSGASTQALARTLYAKGPRLLDGIANDATQPARARIDALRELRMQSGFGTSEDGETLGQKFTLTINVGETTTTVGGPVITPGPHNLLTPEVMPGPTIIDQWVGWEGYDMLGAPPRALADMASGEFLDEITAGIEACE